MPAKQPVLFTTTLTTGLSQLLSSAMRLPFRLADWAWRRLRPDRAVVGVSLAGYHEHLGGVGNYAISLLRSWPAIFPLQAVRLFCSKGTFSLAQKSLPLRSRIEHRFLGSESELIASASDCDVVFFPCGHLDPVPLPLRSAFHLADLQEWFFPEYFSDEELCRRRNRYRTLRAFGVALFVPSEFTRRCVIELLEYPPENVFTLPLLCADLPGRGLCPQGTSLETGQFLYYPADDYPHKNHRSLLLALGQLAREGLQIPLVCTGSRPMETDWESLARDSGVDFLHLGRVSRAEVRWLFDHARALVFPSQFEGFGIPVLEALKCGLPMVCSNFSSVPEVAGDVAEYCDPFCTDDIARAIRSLWTDEVKRRLLREASAGQAEKFSTSKITRRHAETFDAIKNVRPWALSKNAALPELDRDRSWKRCTGREHPGGEPRKLARAPAARAIPDLSVHFFTIVLNGMPFLPQQWEVLKALPGLWHWHVVEGVAELKHDTSWSLRNGGALPERFRTGNRSDDGTSEFLDRIAGESPDRVTVYRRNRPWEGKLEMCQEPLANIGSEVLLWQLDSDEFWALQTLNEVRDEFQNNPGLMAAKFRCHFHVTPDLVLDNVGFYGNDGRVEWLRVWRFFPGDQWLTHEPPVLQRQGRDLFSLGALDARQTSLKGWKFRHFAYVIASQVAFKESYYGYSGAVDGWKALCADPGQEVMPSTYLPWIPAGIWATRCQPEEVFHPQSLKTYA